MGEPNISPTVRRASVLDLPLISAIAARVVVMAGGRIAEIGPTSRILTDPVGDYAQRLLANMLTLPA
jgi:ABC-type microcin C transport system duplicated ATPase subunit YejF